MVKENEGERTRRKLYSRCEYIYSLLFPARYLILHSRREFIHSSLFLFQLNISTAGEKKNTFH